MGDSQNPHTGTDQVYEITIHLFLIHSRPRILLTLLKISLMRIYNRVLLVKAERRTLRGDNCMLLAHRP